ncbi:TonB-dependent receptor [Myroides guanonis]|uniref:Iron complex outermembrane recepter protein n=1 Tax=Myroides guanonis TaxID=1150112 RepID=A0A1I3MU27_9FLAO|nr:TonB-dependent receptor [Myroides guanonis]SFJ00442.1 iron complex outermembrane recepter protein [Myroides guanonis]
MRKAILLVLIMVSLPAIAQFKVSGLVENSSGIPLKGSTIILSNQVLVSNEKGFFGSGILTPETHALQVSYLGFQTLDTVIQVRENMHLILKLRDDVTMLEQLVVNTTSRKEVHNSERMQQQQLTQNYAGSFAKTLEKLAGVQAMEIGAGASKPVIRGLGFNRVAVAENGVKQEGQQWGADHGLEIDALNTEEVEVIKGVGTIAYGSDAIGGVIKINNEKVPAKQSFSGSTTLLAKSVNDSYGISSSIKKRSDSFFYKLKFTAQEYGDFRVPTDNIRYLNTDIPIYNQRMKNTAGKEWDAYAQVGYVTEKVRNITSLSNVYNKSGFFPGSHGLPSIENSLDDGDSRNIDLPNQSVNHLKISNSTTFNVSDSDLLKMIFSYQYNKRKESSYFHSHYGGQQAPKENPNLELQFDLNTFDADIQYEHLSVDNHKTTFGLQQNYQNNTIGGYGFLLPKYNKLGTGLFGIHEHQISDDWVGQVGVRLDYAKLNVHAFYDSLLYNFLISKGESEITANEYAQRSSDLNRDFTSFNAMLGTRYRLNEAWNLGITAGTNFRFPTAIELAANGLHHGAFRHEKGNPNLNPERGWAVDVEVNYQSATFNTSVSPYLYYFSNYIFLKPSGTFSILPDGGQIYEYTQSKALLTGFEWKLDKTFWDVLKLETIFEFFYNKQVTGNAKTEYPLPFSPPVNVFAQLNYQLKDTEMFKENSIYINGKWNAKQQRIAQNEEITDSYQLIGAGASTTLSLNKFKANVFLTATNLLNTKALNHTSYYRPLEIPELGRSFQLMVQIPF